MHYSGSETYKTTKISRGWAAKLTVSLAGFRIRIHTKSLRSGSWRRLSCWIFDVFQNIYKKTCWNCYFLVRQVLPTSRAIYEKRYNLIFTKTIISGWLFETIYFQDPTKSTVQYIHNTYTVYIFNVFRPIFSNSTFLN